MEKEEKEFFDKYIMQNPFDFKSGIINHCRTLDKMDVYEWVAEDELKINRLEKENKQLKDNWNEFNEHLEFLMINSNGGTNAFIKDLLNLSKILRGKDE